MYYYVEKGLITEEQYQKALTYQKAKRTSFQEALINLSYIREDKVVNYCNKILGY
jgi:hypothetical protein